MEGLSKPSRCLFSTMPAAVPEDTEMNKDAFPGLKAHSLEEGKDVEANKYIKSARNPRIKEKVTSLRLRGTGAHMWKELG